MRLTQNSKSSFRRTVTKAAVLAALPLSIFGCDVDTGSLSGTPPVLPDDVGLSAVVAVRRPDGGSIADFIKDRVADIDDNGLESDATLPLPNDASNTSDLSDTDNPVIADDLVLTNGLEYSVVAKWLDPLTADTSLDAPRFGANADFTAYIPGDLDPAAGDSLLWNGSDNESGWLFVNHEYVSGNVPTSSRAASGSNLVFANWLAAWNLFSTATLEALNPDALKSWSTATDRDEFIRRHKKQLGASLVKISLQGGEWTIDTSADNRRFDGTSNSLFRVTGYTLSAAAKDDAGVALDKGVVPGTLGNCSGGVTPWGTIFTGEENAQDWYGDADAWSSAEKFTSGKGFDIAANVAPVWTASSSSNYGQLSVAQGKNNIDYYSLLTEIDPAVAPNEFYKPITDDDDDATIEGDGQGHRKLGSMGRARWENMTVATDGNFELVSGQPIVIYAADDRTNGRIYKFVSSSNYTSGLNRGEIRALLDSGSVYVAHFSAMGWDGTSASLSDCKRFDQISGFQISGDNDGAATADGCGGDDGDDGLRVPTKGDRGFGHWIKLDVNNATDNAPVWQYNQAGVAGSGIPATTTKVGAALKSQTFNLIGGFSSNNTVLSSLHTAATKLGVTQLNRPEDLEYNPVPLDNGNPLLYIAFTKHTAKYSLNDNGRGLLVTGTNHDLSNGIRTRSDKPGRIWVIEETASPSNPSASATFTYWQVWGGDDDTAERYDGGNPDNILVDKDGGVWFGTDGYFGLTLGVTPADVGHDAMYYLDTEDDNSNTYGRAFRILTVPSDAEHTGPSFTPDMSTLFFSVQHPGEDNASSWPQSSVPGSTTR